MDTSAKPTGPIIKYIYTDIKKFIKSQIKIVEQKTIYQLIFGIISLVIVLFGLFADLQQIPISNKKILIIFVFFLLFFYGLGHYFLSKKRLVDLEYSNKAYVYALKLIRRAAESSPTNYVVTERETIYDIQDSGDVIYTRKMKFRCTNDLIPWAIIHIGVVDGDEEIFPKVNLKIFDPIDGSELAYAFIENRPPFKKIAVLLDPPLKPGNTNGLQFTQIIPNAYKDLIEGIPDEGKLEINNVTESCCMKFIAPRGKEFANIHWLDRINGKCDISMSNDHRSTLKWQGDNIPQNKYRYTLQLK